MPCDYRTLEIKYINRNAELHALQKELHQLKEMNEALAADLFCKAEEIQELKQILENVKPR